MHGQPIIKMVRVLPSEGEETVDNRDCNVSLFFEYELSTEADKTI